MKALFLIPLIVLLASLPVVGAEWFVERDGSGDFAIIQEAVDAAASGDTIRIGPGLYEEVHLIESPYTNRYACVCIFDKTLHLIGAGQGATILQPGFDFGVYAANEDGHSIRFDDLTISGADYALLSENGNVKLKNCSITGCDSGVRVRYDNVILHGCLFDQISYRSVGANDCESVRIKGCRTTESGGYFSLTSCPGAEILECELEWRSGLYLILSSDVMIHDCDFHVANCGVNFDRSSGAVRDCSFWGMSGRAIHVGSSDVHIKDNRIETGYVDAITFLNDGAITASGNEISTTAYAVKVLGSPDLPDRYLDFRNNDWGTTDPSEIAAKIWDGYDDSSLHAFVIYTPFTGSQVANEDLDWGAVKRLYHTP